MGRSSQTQKKINCQISPNSGLKFRNSMTLECLFSTSGRSLKFSDYQTRKIWVTQTTTNVVSKLLGKLPTLFREDFGPNFQDFGPRAMFSGIRWAVRRAATAFCGMELPCLCQDGAILCTCLESMPIIRLIWSLQCPCFQSLTSERCFFKLCCCRA